MTALNPLNKQTVRIELMRDECPVIAKFGGNPGELKKQIAKLNRILKTMPMVKVDPMAELKRSRNRRGLV